MRNLFGGYYRLGHIRSHGLLLLPSSLVLYVARFAKKAEAIKSQIRFYSCKDAVGIHVKNCSLAELDE